MVPEHFGLPEIWVAVGILIIAAGVIFYDLYLRPKIEKRQQDKERQKGPLI